MQKKADLINVLAGYLLIGLFALFPILFAMGAGWLGQLLGCNINEGGTDPCVKFGIPVGTILSMIGIIGWLSLITLPGGLLLIILWTIRSYREVRNYSKRTKTLRSGSAG